jgi:hypothetical protein
MTEKPDRRPLQKPDPDRVPQGDEAAERDHVRSRRDVSEGAGADEAADRSRVGEQAERGLESRPSAIP